MKFLSHYQIFENLAQAKSILKKKGLTTDDETYKKIIDKTKKDNYTGLITKLIIVDGEDVGEVFDLYDDLKKFKIDLSKINKLSYDDILEIVYQEDESKESDIKKVFVKDGYTFFIVNFEGNQNLGSPAWCLKTKSNWNNIVGNTLDFDRFQFIVIKNEKIKGNKIFLSTPKTYTSATEYQSNQRSSRFGITIETDKATILFCHDDNNTNLLNDTTEPIKSIKKHIIDYTRKEFDIDKISYKEYKDILYDAINEIGTSSFSNFTHTNNSDTDIIDLYDELDQKLPNWKELTKDYSTEILNDDTLTTWCGLADIFIYENVNKDFILGGGSYFEDPEEIAVKYDYGIHRTKYGILLLRQAGYSVSWFLEQVVKDIFYISYMRNSDNNSIYDYLDTINWESKMKILNDLDKSLLINDEDKYPVCTFELNGKESQKLFDVVSIYYEEHNNSVYSKEMFENDLESFLKEFETEIMNDNNLIIYVR